MGGRVAPLDHDREGRTIYDALADHFQLSEEERKEKFLDEGRPRSRWQNMVRWAVRRNKKFGYLDSPHRGAWRITQAGLELLASGEAGG